MELVEPHIYIYITKISRLNIFHCTILPYTFPIHLNIVIIILFSPQKSLAWVLRVFLSLSKTHWSLLDSLGLELPFQFFKHNVRTPLAKFLKLAAMDFFSFLCYVFFFLLLSNCTRTTKSFNKYKILFNEKLANTCNAHASV